ncbi:DUF2158 domain-containing protein [Candidatus Spongiihabitans sp.]|uniref:DUF2158 domain-containing protein n=1 Tax=Candidatus Spongiihabitans sp. TaxID=3101308 RepID=UPI003C7B44B7
MPNTYAIGDVVQLKTRSPIMTVTEVNEENGDIQTTSFEGSIRHIDHFPSEALELVKETAK